MYDARAQTQPPHPPIPGAQPGAHSLATVARLELALLPTPAPNTFLGDAELALSSHFAIGFGTLYHLSFDRCSEIAASPTTHFCEQKIAHMRVPTKRKA